MVDENGDPNCPSFYKMPLNSTVPESFMLYNQLGILEKDPAALRTVIECGTVFKVECVVPESNSSLQWDYQTVGYDVCFGISFKKDQNEESKRILSPRRVESHRIPESGNFSCEEAGIYELVFDNSYSWFTRKELIYKVAVIPPEKNPYE
ncbi:SEC14-like protein 2 [Caerostris extrusa]|uniref:SEC14-like protein 2 n=1 Tax=Caerostris extrusa TaxID=172846 RepID=A0AAV4P2X0_CAEEX|nr:SEC14-like protein 2 [Caerostris extrusa]